MKNFWNIVACRLPNWMVGWYWRGEARRRTARMFEHLKHPDVIERMRSMPPTHYVCRNCRSVYQASETHTCRSTP